MKKNKTFKRLTYTLGFSFFAVPISVIYVVNNNDLKSITGEKLSQKMDYELKDLDSNNVNNDFLINKPSIAKNGESIFTVADRVISEWKVFAGDYKKLPSEVSFHKKLTINKVTVKFDYWKPNDEKGIVEWGATIGTNNNNGFYTSTYKEGTIWGFQTKAKRKADQQIIDEINIADLQLPIGDSSKLPSEENKPLSETKTINDAKIIFESWQQNDTNGEIHWIAKISKGWGTNFKVLNGNILGYQTTLERNNAIVAEAKKAINDMGDINKKSSSDISAVINSTPFDSHTLSSFGTGLIFPTIPVGVTLTYTHPGINKDGILVVTVAISKGSVTDNATFNVIVSGIDAEKANTAISKDKALFSNFNQTVIGKPMPISDGITTAKILSKINGHKIFPDVTSGVLRTFEINTDRKSGVATININITADKGKAQTATYTITGFKTADEIAVEKVLALFNNLKDETNGTTTTLADASTTLPSDLVSVDSPEKIGFNDPSSNKLDGTTVVFSLLNKDDKRGTVKVNTLISKGIFQKEVTFKLKGYQTTLDSNNGVVAEAKKAINDMGDINKNTSSDIASEWIPTTFDSHTLSSLGNGVAFPIIHDGVTLTYTHPSINKDGILVVTVAISKGSVADNATFNVIVSGIDAEKANTAISKDKALFNGFNQTVIGKPMPISNGITTAKILSKINGHKIFPDVTSGVLRTFDINTDRKSGVATININITADKGKAQTATYTITGFKTADEIAVEKVLALFNNLKDETNGTTTTLADASTTLPSDLVSVDSPEKIGFNDPSSNKLDGTTVVFSLLNKDDKRGTVKVNTLISKGIFQKEVTFKLKGYQTTLDSNNGVVAEAKKAINDMGDINKNTSSDIASEWIPTTFDSHTLSSLGNGVAFPIIHDGVTLTYTHPSINKDGILVVTVAISKGSVADNATFNVIVSGIDAEKANTAISKDKALFNGFNQTVIGKPMPISNGITTAKILSKINGHKIFPDVTSGVLRTFDINTDRKSGVATININITADKGKAQTATYTITGFKTADEIAVEKVLALFNNLKDETNGTTTTLANASTTLPSDLVSVDSPEKIGFNDPSSNKLDGTTVVFSLLNKEDEKGIIEVEAFVSRGDASGEVTFKLKGYQTTLERNNTIVADAKKVINDMGDINKNTSSDVSTVINRTPFDSHTLSSLGNGVVFPTIPVGVTLTYTHPGINKDGILVVTVAISKGSVSDNATFNVIVSGIDAEKANSAISKDKALFNGFNQTVIGKPMPISNGITTAKILSKINGHKIFPDVTSGVLRKYNIINNNQKGVAAVTVYFSADKGKTQKTTYIIKGFKTTTHAKTPIKNNKKYILHKDIGATRYKNFSTWQIISLSIGSILGFGLVVSLINWLIKNKLKK